MKNNNKNKRKKTKSKTIGINLVYIILNAKLDLFQNIDKQAVTKKS